MIFYYDFGCNSSDILNHQYDHQRFNLKNHSPIVVQVIIHIKFIIDDQVLAPGKSNSKYISFYLIIL